VVDSRIGFVLVYAGPIGYERNTGLA